MGLVVVVVRVLAEDDGLDGVERGVTGPEMVDCVSSEAVWLR